MGVIYDIQGNEISDNISINDIVITSQLAYSGSTTGVQSIFITESGKVWMIKENGTCAVVQNGTSVNLFTIDHSVGHANSANYDDGKAYVSDWTDGTVIHVFAVDDANNTMTYTKDITVPQTHGRTEYFVFDGEKQIISLGWNVTHSGDSQYMILGLWKKDSTGTYQNAYEIPVTGVTVAQGMCVHNERVYIVNNTSAYKHIGLVIVDLATGIQVSENSQTGTILTLETEGIIPMTENTFLVVGYNGSQFILTETFTEA